MTLGCLAQTKRNEICLRGNERQAQVVELCGQIIHPACVSFKDRNQVLSVIQRGQGAYLSERVDVKRRLDAVEQLDQPRLRDAVPDSQTGQSVDLPKRSAKPESGDRSGR